MIAVVVAVIALAADFREATWGQPIDVIMISESLPFDGMVDDALIFFGEEYGKQILVAYTFDDGKLIGGGVSIIEYHEDTDDYVKDYDQVVLAVQSIYGPEAATVETWDETSPYNAKHPPPHRGVAIMIGLLSVATYWSTPRSAIIAKLTGDAYVPRIVVAFAEKSKEEI